VDIPAFIDRSQEPATVHLMDESSPFVTQIDFSAALIRLQADNLALREVIKLLLQEEQPIEVNADNLEQILTHIAALRMQDGLLGIENVNPGLAANLQQALDGVEAVDATGLPPAA
jgi:hypothetical protein